MWRLSASIGAAAILPSFLSIPWFGGLSLGFLLYVVTGGWYWLRIAWLTLPRDLKLISCIAKLEIAVKKWNKRNSVLGEIFGEVRKVK